MKYDSLPLVSCILPTHNRPGFLSQAIKYFHNQKYPYKELIIVNDKPGQLDGIVGKDNRIRLLESNDFVPIGKKLNLGIEAATGQIIQKMDDDDYYHPLFLEATVSALEESERHSIVGFDCFLVLILSTGELHFSGYGWYAGGTLCFYKNLWEKVKFRNDLCRAEDWQFLRDAQAKEIKINNPELYIVVRHEMNHVWTKMGDMDVTDHFKIKPTYRKLPNEIMSNEDWDFYKTLMQNR